MSENYNDLTVSYFEDSVEVVKELDKQILSKGAWVTIIYRYKDWDAKNNVYSKDKFTIRRYKKVSNVYKQQSKFNISSIEQAKKIIEALNGWIQNLDLAAEDNLVDADDSEI